MSNRSSAEGAEDAVIGLGSNIDPVANLRAAVSLLTDLGDVVAVSPFYRSSPVGRSDQPDFVNAAARLRTSHSPRLLKPQLRAIESQLGRVRDPADKCGPRTIDLDLLAHGEAVVHDPPLPDTDVLRRWFVAVPLADVWPEWTHPSTGETSTAIAAKLRESTSEPIIPMSE